MLHPVILVSWKHIPHACYKIPDLHVSEESWQCRASDCVLVWAMFAKGSWTIAVDEE